jgi:hypothetical protein
VGHVRKIGDTTAELLDRIRDGGLTPRAVASQMAQERLREALPAPQVLNDTTLRIARDRLRRT